MPIEKAIAEFPGIIRTALDLLLEDIDYDADMTRGASTCARILASMAASLELKPKAAEFAQRVNELSKVQQEQFMKLITLVKLLGDFDGVNEILNRCAQTHDIEGAIDELGCLLETQEVTS